MAQPLSPEERQQNEIAWLESQAKLKAELIEEFGVVVGEIAFEIATAEKTGVQIESEARREYARRLTTHARGHADQQTQVENYHLWRDEQRGEQLRQLKNRNFSLDSFR